jgi:hypothetical protein
VNAIEQFRAHNLSNHSCGKALLVHLGGWPMADPPFNEASQQVSLDFFSVDGRGLSGVSLLLFVYITLPET